MAIVYSDAILRAGDRVAAGSHRQARDVDAMSRLPLHVARRVGRTSGAEESRHLRGFARTRMRGRPMKHAHEPASIAPARAGPPENVGASMTGIEFPERVELAALARASELLTHFGTCLSRRHRDGRCPLGRGDGILIRRQRIDGGRCMGAGCGSKRDEREGDP
nr:hypothetical protein [Burkholderia sp. Bp8998]